MGVHLGGVLGWVGGIVAVLGGNIGPAPLACLLMWCGTCLASIFVGGKIGGFIGKTVSGVFSS